MNHDVTRHISTTSHNTTFPKKSPLAPKLPLPNKAKVRFLQQNWKLNNIIFLKIKESEGSGSGCLSVLESGKWAAWRSGEMKNENWEETKCFQRK